MISKKKFVVIHTLHKQGVSIREIARILGINEKDSGKKTQRGKLRTLQEKTLSILKGA